MSAGLVVPESQDIARSLPSDMLYKLEIAGQIATEILDERVLAWTEKGETQTWIARELGCTQPAVSQRVRRLGVTPLGQGRPREEAYKGLISPEPQEVLPPPSDEPAHYLPDVLNGTDDDLRAQVVSWCSQERRVKDLLEAGGSLNPRFEGDGEALRKGLEQIEATARRAKEVLANGRS